MIGCFRSHDRSRIIRARRSIAQPGRALSSGGRGRRFKSCYSDQSSAVVPAHCARSPAQALGDVQQCKRHLSAGLCAISPGYERTMLEVGYPAVAMAFGADISAARQAPVHLACLRAVMKLRRRSDVTPFSDFAVNVLGKTRMRELQDTCLKQTSELQRKPSCPDLIRQVVSSRAAAVYAGRLLKPVLFLSVPHC